VTVSGHEAIWPSKDWTDAEGEELIIWQQLIKEQPETLLDARLELRKQ